MTLAFWINVLWIGELALESLLVIVVLSRRMWVKLPVFTAYSVWSVLADIGGYTLLRHAGQPAYLYYLVTETVSVVLAVGMTYEIFTHLLSSHQALRRVASLSLRAACALLSLLGLVVILSHSPIGQKGLIAAILTVEESYRVLEVGLIISLFVFSSAFGLHWRRQIFGIALGLGISASIKLAVVAINPKSYVAVGIANLSLMTCYDLARLLWIGYILLPERVPSRVEVPDRSQLEQWNRAVMELIHQ